MAFGGADKRMVIAVSHPFIRCLSVALYSLVKAEALAGADQTVGKDNVAQHPLLAQPDVLAAVGIGMLKGHLGVTTESSPNLFQETF